MSLLDNASLVLTPNAYKEGKLYSVIPSNGNGDFMFTRATTATRTNSAGLVEVVPYNLFQYSEDFSNANWAKTISSITYNQPDPFGGNNAALCTFTNATTSRIDQNYSIVAGNTYTLSAWIKGVDITNFRFIFGSSQAVFVTSQIVNGEWVRVSATVTATTTGTYQQSPARASNTNGESFYIYGAQLVEGTTAKDYLRTETRLNIPRLDYSLGGCPNILLEPQRTNLIQRSSEFDSATWVKLNATVTANAATSPSGVQDADRIQITNATINYLDNASASPLTNGTTYTVSVYARSFGATNQSFRIYGNGNKISSTLTATPTWQRFEYTFTATSTTMSCGIGSSSISDIVVWGYQLEAGSYPTSYIPTTTASVTRNADQCVKTGISSLIGQTEGTMFIQLNMALISEARRIITLYNDINNYISLRITSGNSVQLLVVNASATQVSIVVPLSAGVVKLAAAYKVNDFVFYVNGIEVGADTNGTVPTTSSIYLGYDPTGASQIASGINAATLWKERLTNAQLAQLTTI